MGLKGDAAGVNVYRPCGGASLVSKGVVHGKKEGSSTQGVTHIGSDSEGLAALEAETEARVVAIWRWVSSINFVLEFFF